MTKFESNRILNARHPEVLKHIEDIEKELKAIRAVLCRNEFATATVKFRGLVTTCWAIEARLAAK